MRPFFLFFIPIEMDCFFTIFVGWVAPYRPTTIDPLSSTHRFTFLSLHLIFRILHVAPRVKNKADFSKETGLYFTISFFTGKKKINPGKKPVRLAIASSSSSVASPIAASTVSTVASAASPIAASSRIASTASPIAPASSIATTPLFLVIKIIGRGST